MYINRKVEKTLIKLSKMFKVLLVTGPRQVGKSTTLKHLFGDSYHYVTLDDVLELELAKNDPKLFFRSNPLPLIIDEVQLAPGLFREVKRIVDESDEKGQIILTGSQTFHLMDGVSESLAGRVGIVDFLGLSYREVTGLEIDMPFCPDDDYLNQEKSNDIDIDLYEFIHRGSKPELNKDKDLDWKLYYASYIRTYLERDVRSILNVKNLDAFSNFMVVLASRTGQILNYSSIANEVGVDLETIKSWVRVLETSGIIFLLKPFSNNAIKRTIKSPMLYFLDTGLVSYLLNWLTKDTLEKGALSGAILETHVVSEIVKSFKQNGILDLPLYFYRDKDKKEIDLIIKENGKLYPIEIKKTMNPNTKMAKTFSVLEKALGYEVGNQLILCMIDKKYYLSDDLLAYPIKKI
ncbi:MAG: ATP-binding protein [Bacillota bacterium]